ncbi:MAG: 3-dehydroquinate synthase [Dehalococcoidia bacterium]
MATADRIFLIGLSGSGKSTAGRIVAERLGWRFFDSDRLIEERAGRSIPDIFEQAGEPAFRAIEADVLAEMARERHVVIATGGGAPTDARSREAIASGLVVWLDVTPEQAARRLRVPGNEDRPLLRAPDGRQLSHDELVSKLGGMREARTPAYERSDHVVAVDYYSAERVADRVAELASSAGHPSTGPRRFDRPSGPVEAVVETRATSQRYTISVESGNLGRVGAVCRALGLQGRAFLVTDSGVGPKYGAAAAASLADAGYPVATHTFVAGEEHKDLATVAEVYRWLLEHRVERSDFLVCLGGGVVTDLGGFAAATVLRGVDFVHVPTTLLAMVDAAVGGKTGVDHPQGKNMVGAFAQPRAVVIDPDVLRTLPHRLRVEGLAELLKHGLILDAGLWRDLEAIAGDVDAACASSFIGRSVAIKAAVVSEDEREADLRALLNYGHTVGHAIEKVSGYGTYLHGEAVAIGMRVAGMLSVGMGLLTAAEFELQQRVLTAYGLPDRAPGLDPAAIIEATRSDKKVRAGSVRWVLLEGIGKATLRSDVPQALVQEAVESVTR